MAGTTGTVAGRGRSAISQAERNAPAESWWTMGAMTSQSGPSAPSSGTAAPRAAKRGPRRRAAEIDVDEARKAFFLMVGFIALIWVLQVANWADRYGLDASYGILPRSIGHLPDIFTAPFLHFSWDHIEGNSGPLFVFGLLAAYRGVVKFLGATLIIAVTSGMAVWLFQGSSELTVSQYPLLNQLVDTRTGVSHTKLVVYAWRQEGARARLRFTPSHFGRFAHRPTLHPRPVGSAGRNRPAPDGAGIPPRQRSDSGQARARRRSARISS
jgi:hypothetical protein